MRVLQTTVLLLTIPFLNGCAPVATEKNTVDTQIKFEPSLKDRELPWGTIEASEERWFLPKGKSFVLSGARIMNTFENMMVLGDSLNDISIRTKAHEFARTFYDTPANTTTPKIEESLYLEAALGEKKTVLINLLKNRQKGLLDTLPALARTVPRVKATLSNINSQPLSGLAATIHSLLDNFVLMLEAEGGLKMVWKELRTTIERDYRSQITELGNALAQVSPTKKVTENTKHMRVVLKLPLNPETLRKTRLNLDQIDSIANRIERMSSGDEGLKVLLDVWLFLDDEARQKTFKQMSWTLYQALSLAGDDYVRSLRDNNFWDWNQWQPTQLAIRNGLKGLISYYGVDKLRDKLMPEIQKAVPASFEETLKKEILGLPDLIEKIVRERVNFNINKVKDILSTATNVRKNFVELSVKWGKREIYQGKESTYGLERDRYVVSVSENGEPQFAPDPNISLHSTTANVLGASFSMALKRFDRVTEFEHTTYDSASYYQMVMGMLNKVPAIGGFTKIDEQVYPSYHVLKNYSEFEGIRDVFDKQIDIKTQMGSSYYFAVPDYIALNPPFRMDNARTTAGTGIQFGVAAQAELLRGLSNTVEFFRDWKVNGFDVRMSRYILGDLIEDLPPHLHNEQLFPKDKLFEYCLGISSVILENMKRKGSNLVIFDEGGKIYFGDQIEDAKKAQALMAAMVDVKVGGREDTIRTADVSRFILGMSKFVAAVQGYENSKSTVLHKVEDGEKKKMNELRKSVQQIKLLMAMMSNFLVHKMRRPDGTMDSFYSLKVEKIISVSRNLEDQLLAIQALLTTGETLATGTYLGAAYDIYFGINHVFFRDDKGFYSATDRGWKQPDSYIFTELLTALTRLSTKTDFSRGQINRLIGQFRGQLTH